MKQPTQQSPWSKVSTTRSTRAGLLVTLGILAASSQAQFTAFSNDLAGFIAASGDSSVKIDFDSIPANTDISGVSINGATLNIADGAPLTVVRAVDTFSSTGGAFPGYSDSFLADKKFVATTGDNVLSPGGMELVAGSQINERDGIEIVFSSPVSYFGFDHLSQSRDNNSYTYVHLYDEFNNHVYVANVSIGGTYPYAGGSDFWGVVSTSQIIKRIWIEDGDNDEFNPDSNIGYDTMRFQPVPEPATLAVVGLGFAALLRRRKQS